MYSITHPFHVCTIHNICCYILGNIFTLRTFLFIFFDMYGICMTFTSSWYFQRTWRGEGGGNECRDIANNQAIHSVLLSFISWRMGDSVSEAPLRKKIIKSQILTKAKVILTIFSKAVYCCSEFSASPRTKRHFTQKSSLPLFSHLSFNILKDSL